MNLLIAGSRSFKNLELVISLIDSVASIEEDVVIITGGAVGVDDTAKTYAEENNIQTETFYPDWDRFGKKAGILRNEEMVKHSDKIVVFWNGTSRGSKSTIDFALKYRKDIQVIFDDESITSH